MMVRSTEAQAGYSGCFCVGPQNGQPVCPCRMRSVQIVDGRYVEVTDLGPADGLGAPDDVMLEFIRASRGGDR